MSTFLRQKNVIVTGASSGIGREIALAFSREGANVLAIGRDAQRLRELKDSSKTLNGKVVPFLIDLQSPGSSEEIYERAISEFGSVQILLNNAGVGYEKEFAVQNIEEIENVLNTNLISPIKLTRSVLPHLIKNGNGTVVFVTSLAGKLGFPKLAPYSASKFGVEGFAEALRAELRDTQINICVVRPGITDTNFFNKAGMQQYYSKIKQENKLHSPKGVADAIINKIGMKPNEIVVGSDKIFLKILPFIPYRWRFMVLNTLNKL
jgi:short-subunit dehydrogenase